MTLGTPNQVGQLSPDGAWRWDGTRWVPSGAPFGSGRPRRSRTWLWWLAGGCAVLLLLGAAGGIWGVTTLVRNVQQGGLSCLPNDFPKYPDATVTRVYTYFGTGVAPGDSSECQETLSSNDDVTTVTTFYTSRLDSGDWGITANDTTNGVVRFARRTKPQNVGAVQLLGRGDHTVIEIRFDS